MGGHIFYTGLQNFQVRCLFINRIKMLMVLMSKIYIGENMIRYKMTGLKALFLYFFFYSTTTITTLILLKMDITAQKKSSKWKTKS